MDGSFKACFAKNAARAENRHDVDFRAVSSERTGMMTI
jgi:hypothetical protein